LIFSKQPLCICPGKARIWKNSNSHAVTEGTRHNPKLNVFCALSQQKVSTSSFPPECTVTGIKYQYMVEESLIPFLEEEGPNIIFQHSNLTTQAGNFSRNGFAQAA
jgi:hypothetical protein